MSLQQTTDVQKKLQSTAAEKKQKNMNECTTTKQISYK